MINTRVPAAQPEMRKAPGQRRSKVTVAAIEQAAARVLAAKGWAKFTTNEVARIAGVSIGSLYQYFPNKLALAEAIRRRHLQALLQVFEQSGTAAEGEREGQIEQGETPEQSGQVLLMRRVAQLVDGIIAAHQVDPQLHRVLLDEVPLSARDAHQDFERQYAAFYARFASQSGAAAEPVSSMAGRVLASAVEGVVHDAARRNELASAELRHELCRLVYSFVI